MEKSRYPLLTERIGSLLMMMPQGRIFESLKNRVDMLSRVDALEQCPARNTAATWTPNSGIPKDAATASMVILQFV